MKFLEFLRANARNLSSTVELLQAIVLRIDQGTQVLEDKLQAVVLRMENQSQSLATLGRLESILADLAHQVRLNTDRQSALLDHRSAEITSGIDNLARLLDGRAAAIIVGMDNLSQLLHDKLEALRNEASVIAARSEEAVLGIANQSNQSSELAKQVIAGMDNLSRLIDARSGEALQEIANQSNRSAEAAREIIAGMDNLSRLIDARSGEALQEIANQSNKSAEAAREIIAGMDNLSRLIDARSEQSLLGIVNQSTRFGEVAREVIVGVDNLSKLVNDKLATVIGLQAEQSEKVSEISKRLASRVVDDISPEMAVEAGSSANETNSPTPQRQHEISGQLFNVDQPSQNAVLSTLAYLQSDNRLPPEACTQIIGSALEEVKSMPNSDQGIEALEVEDSRIWEEFGPALFTFWLIRRLRPRDVVQTGGAGEPFALFTTLALSKNGAGRLHLIDAAGGEPRRGSRAIWKVPVRYQHRAETHKGNSKTVLPKIVNQLESINMFVQASGFTRGHAIVELGEVRRKLSPGAVIVVAGSTGPEVAREFAAQQGVPALDLEGSLGVAFF